MRKNRNKLLLPLLAGAIGTYPALVQFAKVIPVSPEVTAAALIVAFAIGYIVGK